MTLKLTNDWLTENNLLLNTDKTKIIEFQTYNSRLMNINIELNSRSIEFVDSTIFLGLHISKNLNWKEHVEKLCAKLDSFVFVLSRLRRVTTDESALMAYHGYVSSILRYGIILWGYSAHSQKVFLAQKRCVRALCGLHFMDTCLPHFKKKQILPLPCLYIFEMCIFVKLNESLFERRIQGAGRSVRYKNRLCVPVQRKEIFSTNAYCMAIRIYNHLPENIKIEPFTIYKRKFFKILLNKCYYSVKEFLNDSINDIVFNCK